MSASRSGQTLYVRSASTPSRSLSTSYRICRPWLGRPTSYASGYISAHRTSHASQSLTTAFSSPPTYWMGLRTDGSSVSSRSKTDSTGIRRPSGSQGAAQDVPTLPAYRASPVPPRPQPRDLEKWVRNARDFAPISQDHAVEDGSSVHSRGASVGRRGRGAEGARDAPHPRCRSRAGRSTARRRVGRSGSAAGRATFDDLLAASTTALAPLLAGVYLVDGESRSRPWAEQSFATRLAAAVVAHGPRTVAMLSTAATLHSLPCRPADDSTIHLCSAERHRAISRQAYGCTRVHSTTATSGAPRGSFDVQVTSVGRTTADLLRSLPRFDSVSLLDGLLHTGRMSGEDLGRLRTTLDGGRGAVGARGPRRVRRPRRSPPWRHGCASSR